MNGRLFTSTLAGLVACAALFCTPGAFAAQVTLEPVQDNTIYQGSDPTKTDPNFEDNSCGAGNEMFTGTTKDLALVRRALVQFDIAGNIPPLSTITGVTLTTTLNRAGDNRDSDITLSPLSKAWGEGTVDCNAIQGGGGQGGDAGIGDATWLDSEFTLANWTIAGGDFGNISATATAGSGNGDQAIWDSSVTGNEAMITDVQSWLDNPGNNFGWILRGDETRQIDDPSSRRWLTREGGASPQLVVEFTGTGSACCFDTGSCNLQADEPTCLANGGSSFVQGVDTCEPNPCPQPSGACCNLDESCSILERAACEAVGGTFQGANSACSDNQVDCGLTPFVDALPIPIPLAPTGVTPEGVTQYTVDVEVVSQQLHSELPDTDVWTYNGAYPSFTIEARSGVPIEVTYNNNLPTSGRRGGHIFEVDECAHGPNYWGNAARISTHLHGGHLPAKDDGQPELTILPGQSQVLTYTNNQEPGTLWYHDHALGITRLNVYAGMAGFYLLRDDFEDALGLPSGEYEIPIVIQDRQFNSDGSFFYPPTIQNAFFGDKVLVNGKVWPFLNVKQGKYRFRILNGSQARQYSLRLENQDAPSQVIPFNLIGTDLGLIEAPIPLDTIDPIVGAERMDVIVDFTNFPAGTEIVLRNDDQTTPLLPNVMKFVVQGQTGFTGPIPTALRPVEAIPESESVATRRFKLERINDPGTPCGFEWLVRSLDAQSNVIGEKWDDISELPQLGTTEIWQFENPSTLMHPMHIHLVKFQVLDRHVLGGGGAPIPLDPWEINTWKDTVKVPPNTQVRVIARFKDYPGRFPYHCHILDHEDHEMMRQFRTTNDPTNCNDDGTCDYGEDTISCPNDCDAIDGALCGNGLCESGGTDLDGDGIIDIDGENCTSCPQDCAGKQKGSSSKQFCCGFDDGNVTNPNPHGCDTDANGNACVDASAGRACRAGPVPPAECGDGLCEGAETGANCPADCLPPPPAQECIYADPTVSITPNAQDITTDSGSVGYTVNIENNDTAACPDTTFNLSVSDTNDVEFVIPSTLDQNSVLLVPGQNTDVTLTVTGVAGVTNATNDTSVATAADANHNAATSNTVTTTINVGGVVICEGIMDRTQCRDEPTCQWKKGGCVTR